MISHPNFSITTTGTEVAKAFADQIKGKTVIITGCSPNNIGKATAQAVAGAHVGTLVISGRSASKLDTVADALLAEHPQVNVRKLIMDLSSQESVRRAAKEVNMYEENVDVLINCAAVLAHPRREITDDGIELSLGSNHIGHWLFTNLIMSKLKAAAAASNHDGSTRIINVTSIGHMYSPFRFSDYNFTTGEEVPAEETPNWEGLIWRGQTKTLGYEPMVAYGQSKTANILFSVYLNQQLSKHGIYSFAPHPGAVYSDGAKPMLDSIPQRVLDKFKQGWKSIDQGASTQMVAAFDPKLTPNDGVFLSDCQVTAPTPWAVDPVSAEKLWKLSEKLTGEEFQF